MNKRNMACKIRAKFDDFFQKVKETLFSQKFTLNLKHNGRLLCVLKAVCSLSSTIYLEIGLSPKKCGKNFHS